SVQIKPGGQAVIGQNSDKITINNNVDLDEVIAWKNGLFYFSHADIKVVMRQLSRWYNVEVLYEGKIPEREFQGEMQRDLNLSQVLKLLSQNNINFKIVGNQLIVKP
ncbi:MAG: FecR domain-containing protein, partial [Ginsengibacter sp.]